MDENRKKNYDQMTPKEKEEYRKKSFEERSDLLASNLQRISGIYVRHYTKMVKHHLSNRYIPQRYFAFEVIKGVTLKGSFSYKKAKAFAEGLDIGRKLERVNHLNKEVSDDA